MATGRAGLRGLLAGYDLDRLPLAVLPVAGEQAASWLSRVAHRYGLTPHALLTAIGAPTPSYNLRTVARHLHRHAAQVTALLGAAAPGRSPADVGFLDGALAGYQHTYAGGVGRWPSGSRFCPLCLTGADDAVDGAVEDLGRSEPGRTAGVAGVWAASWACPLQAVCRTHRVLLEVSCPGCGQLPWSTSAWTARSRPGWTCPEHLPVPRRRPGQPPAAAPGSRRVECGHDLRQVSAQPASDRDFTVQRHLNDAAARAAADPDSPVTACESDTTPLEYLHALLELVTEHRGPVAGLWRLTTDPRLLLDSLAVAVQVLTEPDPVRAVSTAERHRLLHPTGRCTPLVPDSALSRRPRNGLLAALRLGVTDQADGLTPTAQLTFRVGSGRPRYPEPGLQCEFGDAPLRGGQLPLRAVPQLLWTGLLTDYLSDANIGPRDAEPSGGTVLARACVAMFLARVGSTRPWRLIAIELGLPAWFAAQPTALHHRLVDGGRWPAFLADLDELATALQDDVPPVDYRTRRQLCADPHQLLEAVRAGRRHAASELAPDAVPDVPDAALARLFWQTYTGGDLRLAAPPVGWASPAAAAAGQPVVNGLRATATATLLATQAVLEAFGGVGSTGPLVWSPTAGGPAAPVEVLAQAWSRPLEQEQEQDWSGWEHDVALSAAWAAAEQDLNERSFQAWLWDWLQVTYGIPNTDDNAFWPPTVWELRVALTDPDTEPRAVRHPGLAAALQHTTRSKDGAVQRWRLLPDAPAGRSAASTGRRLGGQL